MTKKITKQAFRQWLNGQPCTREFGTGQAGCPLSKWQRREMHLDRLERMPRWRSRFVGHWDADPGQGTPADAKRVLDIVT